MTPNDDADARTRPGADASAQASRGAGDATAQTALDHPPVTADGAGETLVYARRKRERAWQGVALGSLAALSALAAFALWSFAEFRPSRQHRRPRGALGPARSSTERPRLVRQRRPLSTSWRICLRVSPGSKRERGRQPLRRPIARP